MLTPLLSFPLSVPEYQQPGFDAPGRRLDGSTLENENEMKSQIKILEDKIEKIFPNVKQKTEMKNERKREEKQRIKPRLSTFNMTSNNRVPEREKKNGREKIIKKIKFRRTFRMHFQIFTNYPAQEIKAGPDQKNITMEFKNTWTK